MFTARKLAVSAVVAASVILGSGALAAPAQAANGIYYNGTYLLKSNCAKVQQKFIANRAYKIVTACRWGQPTGYLVDGYYFSYRSAY